MNGVLREQSLRREISPELSQAILKILIQKTSMTGKNIYYRCNIFVLIISLLAICASCSKSSDNEKEKSKLELLLGFRDLSTKGLESSDIIYLDDNFNEIPQTKVNATYQRDTTTDSKIWMGIVRWDIGDKIKLFQRHSSLATSSSGLTVNNMVLHITSYADVVPSGTTPTGRAARCEYESSNPAAFNDLEYPDYDTQFYFMAYPTWNTSSFELNKFKYTIANPETYTNRADYVSNNLLMTSGSFNADFVLGKLTAGSVVFTPNMSILRIQLYTSTGTFNIKSLSIQSYNAGGSSINYFSKVLEIQQPNSSTANDPCIVTTVSNSNEFSKKTINFAEAITISSDENSPTVIYILIHMNTNLDTTTDGFKGGNFVFSFTDVNNNTVTLPKKYLKAFSPGKMYNVTTKWNISL